MKSGYFCIFLSICLALTACTGWTAETKIAVADMSKLVKAHPDTENADALLETQGKEFDAERKEMAAQFDKMRKEFEQMAKEVDNKALSEEAKEVKQKKAEDKLNDLREFERKARETASMRQKQLTDQRIRMQKRIVSKINDIVAKYAEKNGYSLVLDSASVGISGVESILYKSAKLDVTDDLLALLAKEKPSKTPED